MTDKAVCWELQSSSDSIHGLRVLLVGTFVGTQLLSSENERPRWSFREYATVTGAGEAAVEFTQNFERDHGGRLVIPPGEILVHPSEVANLHSHGPIPPSLRARVFTSLQRRDPREGGAS
jgi:hypothetical protein